jgi:phosphatidate cytidylyltransferase
MKISALFSPEVVKRIITGTILGITSGFVFLYLPPIITSIYFAVILGIILFVEWPKLYPMNSITFWLLTPIYPIMPFAFMISLNQDPVQRHLLFALVILISTFDTAAYVLGSMFGRNKIAPHISPGKSWEGFIGGYLCAAIGFASFLWSKNVTHDVWIILAFALCVCILGTAGDLFESWLKRRAALKDSGTMLPGHGGFLDRFDGIIFAVLCLYMFKDHLIKLIVPQ